MLGPLHFLLIIAVLTSATAATQTTILPAARTALSMARRGAIPRRFGEIDPQHLAPGYATIVAGVLSVVWFVFIVQVRTNVLSDCVTGLGFLVAFYYGFTGLCVHVVSPLTDVHLWVPVAGADSWNHVADDSEVSG